MASRTGMSLQRRDPQTGEILVGRSVIIRRSGRIVGVAGGNVDDHSLPCAGEENPVGVEEIAAIFGTGDVAPAVAAEVMMRPACVAEAEVAIPGDPDPVEFQPLDLKLGGRVF